MITIHIDTTKDGHTLTHCYKGIKNNILLLNPTREEVIKTLKDNPNDTLMCLGHGSPNGLFGAKFDMAIDGLMVEYLKDREIVGIWCNAKDFGKKWGLKGFFTSMFISNPGEARCFRMKEVKEEVTQTENIFFAKRVCNLLKKNVPLNEWVDILRTDYHTEYDFSVYNMEGIEYLDGTQKAENPYAEFSKIYSDYHKERSMKEIMADMETKVDDLRGIINDIQYKMGFDDSIEFDGETITREKLSKWEDVLDEMESYCLY